MLQYQVTAPEILQTGCLFDRFSLVVALGRKSKSEEKDCENSRMDFVAHKSVQRVLPDHPIRSRQHIWRDREGVCLAVFHCYLIT